MEPPANEPIATDPPAPQPPSTAELRAMLDDALARGGGPRRRVVAVERRTGEYHSSFATEELDLTLDDGSALELFLKDLGPRARLGDAARVRPPFLYDPLREIETYRLILEPRRVGAPRLYAASADPGAGRYLLVLERVRGRPLWQVGEFGAWLAAARWLAGLHAGLAADVAALAGPARLLRYDAAYYWQWVDRARAFLFRGPVPLPADARDGFERLVGRYHQVVDRLVSLPPTLIHGEFYASNVLVQDGPPSSTAPPDPGDFRIRPVDWELAAAGPALMDLADLTSGRWTDGQKAALAAAYRDAALAAGAAPPAHFTPAELDEALDACRLHRAVQWLGWAADWTPPREHAQDWLGEVLRLGGRLVP